MYDDVTFQASGPGGMWREGGEGFMPCPPALPRGRGWHWAGCPSSLRFQLVLKVGPVRSGLGAVGPPQQGSWLTPGSLPGKGPSHQSGSGHRG